MQSYVLYHWQIQSKIDFCQNDVDAQIWRSSGASAASCQHDEKTTRRGGGMWNKLCCRRSRWWRGGGGGDNGGSVHWSEKKEGWRPTWVGSHLLWWRPPGSFHPWHPVFETFSTVKGLVGDISLSSEATLPNLNAGLLPTEQIIAQGQVLLKIRIRVKWF